MLFGSIALEVAIGMAFVYLLLSLLCSAVVEYMEAKLNYRAKDLEKAIRLLLDQTDGQGGAPAAAAGGATPSSLLYSHPLVKSLYRGDKLPSYIPSRTFALALWDMAFPAAQRAVAAGGTHNLATIRQAINDNQAVPASVKRALLALVDDAGTDFDKARKNVEDWYDGAMDRASGWYKRRVHVILLVAGLLVSALVNADTINISKALIQNDALRAAVVADAEQAAKTPLPAATPTPEDPAVAARLAAEKAQAVRAQIDTLGLPIGWVRETYGVDGAGRRVVTNAGDPRRFPDSVGGWTLKVIGLLITALAISQGAPFWFDLLNKFIVIRSTVKPKEKSQEQPSKDRPAPETELEEDDTNKN
jgi:hypothetical protein